MEDLIESMKRTFATHFQYYLKAHGFHVNIVGMNFPQYHELLGKIYEHAQENIDHLGEQIRAIEGIAPFSMTRINELGDIKEVQPAMADSGRMNYGTIGPDKTPVITLPGDPIATALAAEIFVRPMIRTMLGANTVFRRKMVAKLSGEITTEAGMRSYVRAALSNKSGLKAHVLPDQHHLISLSEATALIVVDEDVTSVKDGSEVEVLILDRGSN